jgi:hypothetical protein
MRRSNVIAPLVLGALILGVMVPGAAWAGDPEVKKEGPCSGRSEWKLEVRLEDDNTFRVRWEADSGIPGQRWRMKLRQNGTLIASAIRTTNADGEAQLRLRGVTNTNGPDTFAGRARNIANGETCAASATL